MFLSLFNSFASAKNPPAVVCLQDPPFWRGRLPSFKGFSAFAPTAQDRRPRVAFYVSSVTLQEATVLPVFTDRSDVASLELHSPNLFGQGAGTLSIINCYSVWGDRESLHTVAPQHALPTPTHPTLVVGDFNIHQPLSDPLRVHSQAELHALFLYFLRAADLSYNMLNTPGVYTRFPLSSTLLLRLLPWLPFSSHGKPPSPQQVWITYP